MKKNLLKTSLLLCLGGMMFAGCAKSEFPDYQKTDSGLYYKFAKENKTNQKVVDGDVLVCEVEFKLDSTVLFENKGNPQRMFKAGESQIPHLINEGLMMLHLGDEITLATYADSLSKHMSFPPSYQAGTGQKLYFNIKLQSIVSKAEIDKEHLQVMQAEKDSIAAYITKNNIKETPTQSGLYITYLKKGTGAMAEAGKTVKVNYTGRLLSGKVFDTSLETVAKEANVFDPRRPYEPMEYVCGQTPLIKGWDEAVATMKEGDKVNVLIPSAMGYGPQGSPGAIPPFAPLLFTIELVSVK